MQSIALGPQEQAVSRIVGAQTFDRGRQYAAAGAVLDPSWNPARQLAYGQVRGTAVHPYTATATLRCAPDGSVRGFRGACTCPVGLNCKHSVAVLLAARATGAAAAVAPAADRSECATIAVETIAAGGGGWERALTALTESRPRPPETAAAAVALQFELRPPPGIGAELPSDVGIRPVLRGRRGNWVRSGISWSSLDALRYIRPPVPAGHQRLLAEIVALHAGRHRQAYYYGYRDPFIGLAEFGSRRIWDLLAEAQEAGLPLVRADRDTGMVTVHSRPAELTLDVRADGDALVVTPALRAGGTPVDPGAAFLLGEPAHGLGWWADAANPAGPPVLRLAPLGAVGGPDVRAALSGPPARIPAADRGRFLGEFYPRLRRLVPIVSSDESVALPEVGPPVLGLTVACEPEHRLRLQWAWYYPFGETELREPLWSTAGEPGAGDTGTRDPGTRDTVAEQLILARVAAVLQRVEGLLAPGPDGRRPAASQQLAGMDTVRFLTDVLPQLEAVAGVRVTVTGEPGDYRAAESAPVIAFGRPGSDPDGGAGEPADRDWFDLAVTVSVDGETVGFEALFVALAAGQPYLILASGTYFALDRPEFAQLAALIGESRDLFDAPPGTVRLSRFQASMWDELERIGVVGAQAAAWQAAARALCTAGALDPVPVPSGLRATLRPYQKDGLDWLACLFGHGLGGVLADEMGLGKTVQAIALFCDARERCDTTAPFLVVAPTSVVHNWAAECTRFAPHLSVRTVSETAHRRGAALAEAVAGADVVVTSYTLFRLEYDDYAALDWAGLVLDEAQFVKNHQAKGYQCAKKLPAPFKLAITGTPMENNLMELWALLSITAPGLFPSPHRFADFYRAPIEREHDADRLDQLRRRTRPLMLRRTKDQVITDLPDKQEQVVELELNARHRKVYQTHLQRERQKVLGLLGDLEGNRFEIFRSLTLLRQASLHAALIDPSYAKVPSTKLDALLEQVAEIVAGGHRVVVFSQFTRFLAAARERLDAADIEYCYLDGKTRKRAQVLERFKSGSAPVFLISLKAGGVGLNLTEADYCIILDPWWNPAVEAQAVDRLHRIGQRHTVMVYRLVAAETIEQKVMALKAEKAALFDSVVNGGGAASGALTAADIRSLVA